MKKIVLFFFFSICFVNSKAQTSVYHPFPDSDAAWKIGRINYKISCNFGSYFHENYSYIFTGDTVINSQTYHKVSIAFIEKTDTCTWWHSLPGYVACIRQDIIGKKAFCIPRDSSSEYVLYDFNLQPGDTVPTHPHLYCGSPFDTIRNIDSVLIGSGYRKRWNVTSWAYPNGHGYSIIEGIGSTSGLFELCSNAISDFMWELVCFQQNGSILYHPPDSVLNYLDSGVSCNIITSIISLSLLNNIFSIYPNPSTNKFTISFSKPMSNASLKIFNMMGEEVYAQTVNGKQETVNIKLSSGIYFVQVREKERQWVEKIVVE